jgi:hypothetical protein
VYADDTTLIVTSTNIPALRALAQTELTSLIRYFHINNLVPNPTKTNYSIFYPHDVTEPTVQWGDDPHPRPVMRLNVQRTRLKQKTQAKLLGVMIQDNLKYDRTVLKTIKKLQPTIQCFKYANKLLPTETMRQLYYSQIFPHLIGEITVWGSSDPQKTYLQPLIKTQKRIIRLIKNLPPRTHTKPLMLELNILNITNLYIHRTCMQLHNFIHPRKQLNRPQHNTHPLWTSQVHDYPTRYSLQCHQYVPNPDAHRHSRTKTPTHETSFYATEQWTIWNSVPEHIRAERKRGTFKRALKEHLLQKQSNDR